MGEKWNDKCCNKFIERAIVCLCKGWFRGDLLFMIVRKLRPSAGDGELIIWIWRPPMVLCEIVISLIVFDSLRLSFDQFLPISGARPPPGAKSSPFVWVKVRADWKARRGMREENVAFAWRVWRQGGDQELAIVSGIARCAALGSHWDPDE